MVLVVLPLPKKKNSQARFSILIGIFACFGALRRVTWVMDGWFATQECDQVGQIKKTWHLLVLLGLFSYLPMIKMAKRDLVIFVVFLVTLGRWGDPWSDGCSTPGDWLDRKRFKILISDGFKGSVFLFSHEKHQLNRIWLCWWYFLLI